MADKARVLRELAPAEVKYLLSIKEEDVCFTLIESLIGDHVSVDKDGNYTVVPSRYAIQDKIKLAKGEYFNKEAIETTVGSIIFNKIVLEHSGVLHEVGFTNEIMRSGAFGKLLQGIVDTLIIPGKYSKVTLDKIIDQASWLGGRCHTLIMSSFTPKTVTPLPSVVKARDAYLKEHAKEIAEGNVEVTVKLEKMLLAMAKEELKDDPGFMLYDSEARGSFNNNYKQTFVMRGAVLDPRTGKQDIIKHGFMEGYAKDELPAAATTIVLGAYPKGVGTAIGGYMTKKLYAALQAITIGDVEDCGSTVTHNIVLTKDKINFYKNTNIVENGKLVELLGNNIGSYVGKPIKVRLPIYCKGGGTKCRACGGAKTILDALEIKAIGLVAPKMSGNILNGNMKKFHDATIKLYEIDADKMFI